MNKTVPPDSPPMSSLARTVVLFSTMLAVVMQGLDSTIANVALPYMQGSMSASQAEIDWVLTSYIVAAAIMTAPTAYIAGRFGRKRVFVTIIIGFTLASALCGAAQSLDQILLFRVLQGMCGASIIPLSQVTLIDIYPPEERGTAMGIWTTGVMMGPILGPTIGGFLTAHYDWRWVFYVNLPLGILAAAGLLTCLQEGVYNLKLKLDWLGFTALALAIGMFQTILDRGDTLDWYSSHEIIIETFLAGIGFYIFLVQFCFAPRPFLTPRLFKDSNFIIGMTMIFVHGATLYATMALTAPYVQNLMNFPVSIAGIAMAPRGVGAMLAAYLCGRLLKVINARILVGTGILVSAYVLYSMVYWTPDISFTTIVVIGFIQGISMTLVTVPISTITFATVPVDLRTEASSVFNLIRTMGSAIGIAVTSAVLQSYTQINHAEISTAITPFNRSLNSGMAGQIWNPLRQGGAMALNGEIDRQSAIIAYSDDFKLMFLAVLLMLPLILLIRSPSLQAPAQSKEILLEEPV